MCGIIKPTKPIMPEFATIKPVNNEAIIIYTFRYNPKEIPRVTAASSPSNIVFKTRNWKEKNKLMTIVTIASKGNFPQLAEARLPIDQKVTVFIPSALFAKKIIKLEIELNIELMTVPERTNLIDVILPPILERISTSTVANKAPKNALKDKPICENRPTAPKPTIIAKVAPKEAPEEIPKIYGSANGFWTTACMIVPQIARPQPIKIADNTRGERTNQMILTAD